MTDGERGIGSANGLTPVRVVASPRRRSTVSARLVDGVIELRVPAWMSLAERERWADRMRVRIERQVRRAGPTDDELEQRARVLNRRHFDGRLSWSSIAYAEQRRRWGSCSPAARLIVAGHGPQFWRLVNRYPLTERARGYLLALDHQAGDAGEPDPVD
jgi:predicted metal-dependent hydrolase